MPAIGLPAEEWDADAHGHFLTFVLPAISGCNLKCSFCFISHRKEITSTQLDPGGFVRFIRDMVSAETVIGIAMQGYEPLLPGTLPYTEAILATGRDCGIPVSMVTNGTHLRAAMDMLAASTPNKIGVSIDAAAAEQHDKLRGVSGAWQQTVDGIGEGLRRLPDAQKRFVVVSTLLPGKRTHLDDMPRVLAALGIREWIVNPLITFGRSVWAEAAKRQRLAEDLTHLSEGAARHGIELTIDDELGIVTSSFAGADAALIAHLPIRTLPKGITLSRMVPSGQVSVGMDIARAPSPAAPRWTPDAEHPAAFLAAMQQHSAAMRQAA